MIFLVIFMLFTITVVVMLVMVYVDLILKSVLLNSNFSSVFLINLSF